jgi:hypothetical protein
MKLGSIAAYALRGAQSHFVTERSIAVKHTAKTGSQRSSPKVTPRSTAKPTGKKSI